MCGGGGILESIFGGGDSSPPPVVAPAVVQDTDKAAAESASAGIAARSQRKRALRAQSLLATGATGDSSNVITGQPAAAAGKATLGA